MKWRTLILSGAFIGTFILGAIFSPVSKSIATNSQKKGPVDNTPMSDQIINSSLTEETTNSYTCPLSGAPMGSGYGTCDYFSSSMFSLLAESLGMTDEQYQAERYDGESIAELAEEKGKSVDELVNQVVEIRKTALEQLVETGEITAEQRDIMLEHTETRVRSIIENDTNRAMHRHGAMGMGHHRGYSNNSMMN